ncbi:MAG: T9SS type A sorting domain-containing protein [Cyclobacteriaceae bacterium]
MKVEVNIRLKGIVLGIAVLIIMFPKYGQAQSLEEIAETKITELEALMESARESGIDVVREEMVVRTAEIFLEYADYDQNNPGQMLGAFQNDGSFKDRADEIVAALPDKERSDVIIILDESIAELQEVINGEITRIATPKVDWSKVSLDGDQLTFEGRPVFLADYTWKQRTEQLTEYHGSEDGLFIAPFHSDDANGKIKQWLQNSIESKPDGNIGFIFMNQRNPPSWVRDKYPNITVGGRLYTEIDIDSPGSRELWESIFSAVVPNTAGKKYSELGYMLTNEPHWNTIADAWETGPVSDYTHAKFRVWLEEKHQDIESLNTVWGSAFDSFESVEIAIPIAATLQGTAKWYDWMKFNQHRVTEWFTFLDNEIKKYDPDAKSHIKVIPHMWSGNKRDHGLDFEALTRLSGINGNDAGSRKFVLWGGPYEWQDTYALEWHPMAMPYDFFTSVEPGQINYNTEAHYITKTAFKDLELDPNYVRSIFWFAHMQGADANQTWVWPREEGGSLRSSDPGSVIGSPAHQPRVVEALHTTIMDLNSFSEEIKAVQRQRRPIRIFYSETSAIVKSDHMDDVFDLYESLFFEGISVGFASENIIKLNDQDWDAIAIYETEFVTESERDALQSYLDAGGTIIMDSKSIKKNEYGEAITGLSASAGTIISASSVESQKEQAIQIVSAKGGLPEVSVTETNAIGKPGCVWRCVKNEDGDNVLSVVNVGKSEAQLVLELEGASIGTNAVDMFTGETYGNKIELSPHDVFFVKIKDEKASEEVLSTVFEQKVKLFPNPTGGNFTVSFPIIESEVQLSIIDISGRRVFQKTYHERAKITETLAGQPSGTYIVKVNTSSKNEVFRLIKR